MASSYGWAAVAIALLTFLILAMAWIRRGKTAAVESAARAAACEDAGRKAAENAAVVDVERRDLPGGVAGPRLHDVPRGKHSETSGPGGA